MNCLGTPQHRKLTLLQGAPVKLWHAYEATYISTTNIILPFVDNFTPSSTDLFDSSLSPSLHSLRAAPDRAQVQLLLYGLKLRLPLCSRYPRRLPLRTASLLVTLLFVFHRIALGMLLESWFSLLVYTRV